MDFLLLVRRADGLREHFWMLRAADTFDLAPPMPVTWWMPASRKKSGSPYEKNSPAISPIRLPFRI